MSAICVLVERHCPFGENLPLDRWALKISSCLTGRKLCSNFTLCANDLRGLGYEPRAFTLFEMPGEALRQQDMTPHLFALQVLRHPVYAERIP
jgi:hypothetical protein